MYLQISALFPNHTLPDRLDLVDDSPFMTKDQKTIKQKKELAIAPSSF